MNPFIITAYKSPEYFCDREVETENLIASVSNGVNIVLYSLRRIGKTGLIKNAFHKMSIDTDYQLIYLDIYRTQNLDDFVNMLATAMLGISKKQWYKKAFDFLKILRPVITVNQISGQLEVEIKPLNAAQGKQNLDSIFDFFEHYPQKIIIAIDEFQQITEFPEPGFEAWLRSKIQFLNNVNFIFSGSNRRIITSMFHDYNRPFYQSGATLYLDKIPKTSYSAFIQSLMEKSGRKMTAGLIEKGLDWTESFTWFSQFYFNRIWGKGVRIITESVMQEIEQEIFAEKERTFIELRNLLPQNQMDLLIAIARENVVTQPTSREFISTYQLASSSTVNSALKVLEQKELIYHENNTWQLYDVFLKRSIQST